MKEQIDEELKITMVLNQKRMKKVRSWSTARDEYCSSVYGGDIFYCWRT